MIPYAWIEAAGQRIRKYIHPTPVTFDPELNIYLKWENHQVTGSFKARGALNKLLSLEGWERDRRIVAASAGNHGQGVALAGQITKSRVVVFASESAIPYKLEAMRRLGAELRLVPGGYGEAEKAGLEYAGSTGSTWVSPYNDGQVIAGQGTLALEAIQDIPDLERSTWLVPVSGGGLISGVGAALKERAPSTQSTLIGVQTNASAFMHGLYYRGTQKDIQELPSLADGLAGPVEEDSVTIPMVRNYVDDLILVGEDETEKAIFYAWHKYHERIEGSAAVTLAAILSGKVTQRPATLVISGGNIQPEIHEQILKGTRWTA
jgi:threonine dehydratase